RWLEAENDPRRNEMVSHLNQVVEEARIRGVKRWCSVN
ncbi:hypothetical protein AB2910_25855, partial [Escherichia coli]